jgi:hypothetical protein
MKSACGRTAYSSVYNIRNEIGPRSHILLSTLPPVPQLDFAFGAATAVITCPAMSMAKPPINASKAKNRHISQQIFSSISKRPEQSPTAENGMKE